MKITVYTPTFNRASTLPRVYKSLINQTEKEFVWLIIDDGSIDDTEKIVSEWMKNNIIKIQYIKKRNEGKTSALNYVYNNATTKYIVGIDSDDELLENAIELILREWEIINANGLQDTIGSIRALNMNEYKKITYGYGQYKFPNDTKYIDATWQEFVLKDRNNNECLVSEDLEKIKECALIENHFWLSDKVNTIGDFNLAARLGRKYKSRLINQVVSIVHYDADNSLLRMTDYKKLHYNSIVSSFFFLNENLDYFSWNRKYFIKELLRFSVSIRAVKISSKEVIINISDKRFKILYKIFTPISFFICLYYKIFNLNYWFTPLRNE